MGWASFHITRLLLGETVSFRPKGGSMIGRIASGDLCTVEPIAEVGALSVGDIVLCRVGGNEYLHLIKAIRDDQFQIGNNKGRINGWVPAAQIFGRCVKVER